MIVAMIASALITAWFVSDDRSTVAVLALHRDPPTTVSLYQADGPAPEPPPTSTWKGITLTRVRLGEESTQAATECISAQARKPGEPEDASSGVTECGTVAVPGRAALLVTASSPPELRAAFPLGTTLIFQLDGDSVRVRAVES